MEQLIKINSTEKILNISCEQNELEDCSKSNVKITLVDPTYTQQQISSEAMPSPIGGIAINTEKLLKLKNPIQLFKFPEEFIKSIEKEMPDIIGFSNYVWNFQLSLSLAKAMKKRKPEIITIMGGPNYPISPNEKIKFLEKYEEIDFYIAGEGETAFANLISILVKNKLNKKKFNFDIPSVQFIDESNTSHISEPIQRIKNLSEFPSPYTTGKLDKFFDGKLLPTIQTTRGCPFGCTFCVEGEQYYSKVSRNNLEKITAELNYVGKKIKENRENIGGRNDLWIVDSNFGMYSQDIETCKIIAECQKKYQWPEYIQVDTGKNNKARVLDAAKLVNGAIRLSGAVQSLDEQVLKNVKRSNISADTLMQMAVEAAEIDADSRSDIILGLPGESLNTHFETLKTVTNAGFSHVNTYQCMMLPGTELSDPDTREKYKMKTKFRVLPRCFGFYEIFGKKIISAEIEEICVSTESLSFDDYVNSRKMHLLIHIYFNDGLFGIALKFLKNIGISVFEWLETMFYEEMTGKVKEFFDLFKKDTKNELWDKKEDLLKFIEEPGIIEKYIKGDIGYNLIFVYQSMAMNKYIDELKIFAMKTMEKVLKRNNKDSQENLEFISQTLNFDLCCLKNLFSDIEEEPINNFDFDIEYFQKTDNITNIKDLKLKQPLKLKFILKKEQKEIIKRSIQLYDNSDIGISRILTKVFVKRLLRTPIIHESNE
ncbi:MAG: hypothetical protein CXT78_07380 [Thaumarchaeota archaeon]|nr:MAG: hypothetical protein CXT78_07380 [Nitrososphaerota archaeon]